MSVSARGTLTAHETGEHHRPEDRKEDSKTSPTSSDGSLRSALRVPVNTQHATVGSQGKTPRRPPPRRREKTRQKYAQNRPETNTGKGQTDPTGASKFFFAVKIALYLRVAQAQGVDVARNGIIAYKQTLIATAGNNTCDKPAGRSIAR